MRFLAAAACALLFASPRLFPQTFPPLSAGLKAAEYGRKAAGSLSWKDLAEISLWASGVPDPYAPASRGKPSPMDTVSDAVTELLAAADFPGDAHEKGEYILDFMFGKFLKSYVERQTGMDTLLSNGTYNCVSSAVLYTILAKASGLELCGVITRDHAFVKILSSGGEIDVETTNAYGFDPGNRRDFHDDFGRRTGFAYVPARNYRDRADISPLELSALIFNNRITELESRNRFAEALSLALEREALLSSFKDRDYPEMFVEPRRMVMDRISNYGTALLRQGKEGDALKWAELAAASYPEEGAEEGGSRWDELAFAALNNLLAKLTKAARFEEARAALDANEARLSPALAPKLSAMRKNLVGAELSSLVSSVKNSAEADRVLEILRGNSGNLEDENYRELSIFLALKKGEFTAKEQGFKAAAEFAENAAEEYGGDPRFSAQIRVFRNNRIVELHNAFAAAYNRRDFDAARKIVLDALEEFPGESRLLADSELAENAPR